MESKKDGYISPSSSPPTPLSPLPLSTGPGNREYFFLPSPSPWPPLSGHTLTESLPLLQEKLASLDEQVPSTFSLDRAHRDGLKSESSCLKELEYLPRMLLMLSISGLTPCPVTQRVCPNMNHRTCSRERKSACNDSMKKMRNVKNCSTHNCMVAFHQSSSPGSSIHKCSQSLISPCMVLSLQFLQGLATTMGSWQWWRI